MHFEMGDREHAAMKLDQAGFSVDVVHHLAHQKLPGISIDNYL